MLVAPLHRAVRGAPHACDHCAERAKDCPDIVKQLRVHDDGDVSGLCDHSKFVKEAADQLGYYVDAKMHLSVIRTTPGIL